MTAAGQPVVDIDQHDSLEDIPPPSASLRLIGHDQAFADMLTIVRAGHHAILLEGEAGIGKATAAFHLANRLLTSGPKEGGGRPLPLDPSKAIWRQIAQGAHPNLMHLTRPPNQQGSGYKTVITIDEVRKIGHFLGMTASVDAPRIIIIDPVGDMQRPAANALLKTLEEPPPNTLFLLISHSAGGVLATIRSRCQRVRFTPLDNNALADVLKQVAPQIAESATLGKLAALADGSPRRAITLALYGGLDLRENLERLTAAPRFDTLLAHKLAEIAGGRGNDTQNALLREMMQERLQAQAKDAALARRNDEAERLASFAAELSARFARADGFGLDRKQEFLVTIAQLHSLLHGR